MNILTAEKITKSYSEIQLLSDLSIGIDDVDKIGLIGTNGTGKSTLLKILSGAERADSGSITTRKGLTIEYLSQNPDFDDNATVIQQVFKGNSPIMNLLREYELALTEVALNPDDSKCQNQVLSLSQKIDNLNAWSIENEAKAILTKLGISNFSSKIGVLSGGQKKRIALASALISPSDLLILDEPTNHMDNDVIDWLEKYLNTRKGALLLVTHDRYFLQRVCKRIVEIDNGSLFSYNANYEKYLELKSMRDDSETATQRKKQSLFRKELAWIQRGARARSTKQKARIERFDVLEDSIQAKENNEIQIDFDTKRLGKKIIELTDTGKDYDENSVISKFSYVLTRNDRIGIIGPNGSGKSTLLNLFSGILQPTRGVVEIGETVKIGFFTQDNEPITSSLKVVDYLSEQSEDSNIDVGPVRARKLLEMFLFPQEVQWKSVSKLSGGERRRLYLLKILMSSPNILFLDEPTNDLDINTLTVLENYLADFPGPVIAVSHDRYFLDKMSEKLFIFDNVSSIKLFQGNYTEYSNTNTQEVAVKSETPLKSKPRKTAKKNKSLKFTYKEQREFEEIDSIIAAIENEIVEVDLRIKEDSSDFTLLQQHAKTREILEANLNQAMERWVYLNELAEAIENSKQSNIN